MTKKKARPATTIEGLQAELDARRDRVEAAKAHYDDVVAKAGIAIDEAKGAVDEYVSKIAAALGLPDPAARERRRQETILLTKTIKARMSEGASADEIVDSVTTTSVSVGEETVRAIISKLNGKRATGDDKAKPLRLPPEAGEKGWKREKVRTMFLEGKTRGEIADALDTTKDCVNSHIAALRTSGRLPTGSIGGAATPPPAQVDPTGLDGADDGDGDSLEDLRTEVARQQGGSRSKAATLAVSFFSDHDHTAVVDRMGDGVTQPDATGHQHRIFRFVSSVAAGHQHGLLAREP